MLLLDLGALFLAGILLDALNTLYVRSITERARLKATVLSGVITVLSFGVFAYVLASPKVQEMGSHLVAYALGNSVGTYVGVGLRRPVAG